MKKTLTRKQIAFRENALGWIQALFFCALVVCFFIQLFRYRENKGDTADRNKSGGMMLLSDKSFAGNPEAMSKWLENHDPALMIKGNPNFGYAGFITEFLNRTPDITSPAVETPTSKPEFYLPPPFPSGKTAQAQLPDLSLSTPVLPERVVVLADNGKEIDIQGFFRAFSGGAEKVTMVRVSGKKDAVSQVVLLQSCGKAELDRYAMRELSRMLPPESRGVYSVIWPGKGAR